MDFTLVDDGISNETIQDALKEVFRYVREEANIPLAMEDFGIHETEKLCFPLESRPIFESYAIKAKTQSGVQ